MSEMEITTATKTSIGITMETKIIRVGPMFHLKILKLLLGMVEVVWRELRIYCIKVLRIDLANIGHKVDAHGISIKHLKLQMAQLSSIVNPRQPSTLPCNNV